MNYTQLAERITDWIKDYTLSHNLKTLVVGVSGGIDSAVTSTLASKTELPTYVLSMPIKQKIEQKKLANLHLNWLKKNHPQVHPVTIDLTQTFLQLVEAWEKTGHGNIAQHLHAQANSRSRLRMVALYHISSATHGLVVGTGNKIEDYGIGFFTKYGDGGVDIAPIADLYKSEVYRLAETLGIEEAIRKAEPTDGLWDDGRSDRNQIGCSYDDLEGAMRKEDGEQVTVNEKSQLIYDKFKQHNRHKVLPIPIFKLKQQGFTRSHQP